MSTDRADPPLGLDERKVLYRCRRGTRELDQILVGFFQQHYRNLEVCERQIFCELLEVEDARLIDWLCNGHPVMEGRFKQIVKHIANALER